MRIEQYFLMTDYSLWEVILNGDSPALTRVVDGVFQPVAPTTAEQRLARKNELKARATLLMALPDKHQLKFNSHKDAKTLMDAIEKRSGVSAAPSISAVCAKMPVSSLPNVDSMSNDVIYLFFASQSSSPQLDNDNLKQIDADDLEEMDLKWKGHFIRECRSLKDTKRNEEEPTNYALMAFLSSSSSSDTEVVSYSKACTKAYATLQSHYVKLIENYRKSQFDVISYQTGLKFIEAKLLVYKQNESVFEEDIKLLKLEVQLRDSALVSLRQNLEKAEQERDDLKLIDESLPPSLIYHRCQSGNGYHAVPPPYTGTFLPPKPDLVFNNAPNDAETNHPAFNVKLNPTKPDQDLSHTNRPSAPIIEDWVSDLEDESKTKPPQNTAFPKPTSNGKLKNRKACFVCKSLDHLIKDCDYHDKKMAQPTARNHPHKGNHKQYAQMTHLNPQRHMVPATVLTQSKQVPITAVRPVSTVVPKTSMTRPKQVKPIVTKPNSPTRKHINRSPSLKVGNSPPRITAVKALVVISAQGMQEKWECKPKCQILDHGNPQHALKDKEPEKELNGGYVAFGGNPKGGKISRKGKIKTGKLDFDDVYFVKELKFNLFSVSQMCDKKNSVLFTDTECLVLSPDFKLPDESQVLLRVPKKNNMYNVNLKNTVPSGDLTCLFAKATIDESNLWHRRLGHINLKP
uniref:Ribonuclease H-like domain-containing protein n=1 Tax=Tanacetum cinerariifolium TaxID=118510 RepID=A0A6L2JFE9_TANCI|nr:ribonuclease H-like domain-containing protein [Tanacetum cinerariifolium]